MDRGVGGVRRSARELATFVDSLRHGSGVAGVVYGTRRAGQLTARFDVDMTAGVVYASLTEQHDQQGHDATYVDAGDISFVLDRCAGKATRLSGAVCVLDGILVARKIVLVVAAARICGSVGAQMSSQWRLRRWP